LKHVPNATSIVIVSIRKVLKMLKLLRLLKHVESPASGIDEDVYSVHERY